MAGEARFGLMNSVARVSRSPGRGQAVVAGTMVGTTIGLLAAQHAIETHNLKKQGLVRISKRTIRKNVKHFRKLDKAAAKAKSGQGNRQYARDSNGRFAGSK